MKTEKPKKLIRWYILGAIGAVLMAAGDWLLGVRSASENRHQPFQQSLLSVWLLWAVEARAYRWTGSDWGLSLLLCGKSTECGH